MEKIVFTFEDTKEEVEFFVLEQTKLNGSSYILVADSEEDEAECLILKDTSAQEDVESVYEIVEDESDVKIAQVILNYFIAVRKKWPTSWNEVKSNNILNKTTGFIALMKLFKDVYLSINKEIPSISDFYSMFENVSIEDDNFTRQNFPSGGSGENELYQVFRKSIFNT